MYKTRTVPQRQRNRKGKNFKTRQKLQISSKMVGTQRQLGEERAGHENNEVTHQQRTMEKKMGNTNQRLQNRTQEGTNMVYKIRTQNHMENKWNSDNFPLTRRAGQE